MDNHLSLSVIIPALNEEKNLADTVQTVLKVVPRFFSDWELFIFNDGSSDNTGTVADHLANHYPQIQVIHHLSPSNLGGCYKEGIQLATKSFAIMVPGDNECGEKMLEAVFRNVDKADIIIPYTVNNEVRPLGRRVLSRAFVLFLNLISGVAIRYYNGTVLHRTAIIKQCPIYTNGFGYQAEALVWLLKHSYSYIEIPAPILYRAHGDSKALSISNVLSTFSFLIRLFLKPAFQR